MCKERLAMPQVDPEDQGPLVDYCKAYGVDVKRTEMLTHSLRHLQCRDPFDLARFDPENLKVPIIVAHGRQILDGNHRHMAHKRLHITFAPVLYIDMPFEAARRFLNRFPLSYHKDFPQNEGTASA